MKKLVRIFAIVFVISVLLLAVTACNGGCNGNHSWSSGNVTKQPTCTEVGEITFVCLECGEIRITTIDKVEHSWNDGVVTKDPTCTSVGEKTFECSVCHTTKTEELAFCEHTYLWNEEISATCTEKGIAAHFACTVCGGLFDANKVATTAQALEISAAHDFGKKTVVTEATCAKEGLAKQICSICGHEETSVIPKTEQHVVVTDSAVSATCTQTGLTEGSHCEVCGTVIVAQKVVPVTAHSWSAWATTQPATCTATGTQQRECSVCGKTETSEIAKLSHTYQITVVAPTCTEGGYTTHKCTRCGNSFTDSETAALQHNYVATVKAPTCTEGGYTTHECTRCGNSFTDSETAALQHNYVATVKAPTCTEGGYTTHACSRCGNSFTDSETPALGHTESGWIVDKAPTCLAKGLRHTECTVCHQTITTEEIATTAHTFGESQTFKPTCYADGYTFHTCQVCGLVEKFDIVPAAHRVVVDQAVEPTCTKTGLTEGSHCSFCGTVLVAQQVVAKVAHTEAVDAAVAPTCSATGLTEGSHCEVCGEVLVAQQIVEKLAHTAVTDSAVAATCTATGLTEGSHCSVCNEIIVAQQIVEKLAHTAVTDSAVAATCTATGLTEGSHCSVCNTVLVAQQVIPATGHTAVTDSAVAATCSSTGLTEGSHCSVCNEILVAQQIVEKLAHTAVTDIAVSATCTETGLTEGSHCSVCNIVLVAQQVIPATGHTEVVDNAVAATCSSTGLTEGSHCSVCNEVLVAQQIVEKLAHTAVTDSAVAATCTATGLTEGSHCSVCGEVIVAQQVVPATGHAWGSWKTVTHATCTQQGEKTRVCAVCDETETQRILPVGHTQIQLVGTPATCTQDGISNGVICAVCNTIIVAQQTLPALGHSWQEGYTTNDAQHWKVCTREGCDAISELANHDHSLFCMVCGWVSELACFKFEAGESYAYFQTLSDVLAVVPTDNTEVTITLLKDASGSGATIAEGTNINWNLANHTYTVTDGGSSLFAVRKAPRAITVAFTLEEGSVLTISDGTIALGTTSANVLFVQNNTLTLQNVTLDASTSTAETTTALSVHIGTTNILENVTLVSKNGEAQGVALEMMFSKAGTEINVAWNAHNAPTMDGKIIYGCKTAVYQDDWVKKVVFVVGDENGTVSYSVGSATAVTPDNESVSFDGLDSMLSDKTMVGEVHTHNWNDGETTLAPTCTETGVFTYTCTGCGATKATVLNALGHTIAVKENRVEATCTADGSYDSVVYCSVCDAELSRTHETITALGHDLVHHDAKAPTCTEIGWEAYDTCSRCDYTTYIEKPATGHNASEWIIDVNETCTTDGSKHKECTVCHVTLETVVIDKLGHDLVHHDAQAPTCTEIGWDAYDTCSRCDYTTYVEKPATGHTLAAAVEENRVEATCLADGHYDSVVYCSVCDAELSRTNETITAIGHAWGEWTVTTLAICTAKGEETRICGNDASHKETREVMALGHDLVHHDAQAPTCTEIGWEAYDTCSRCDYTTYVEKPATGHNASEWIIDVNETCTTDGSKHKECTVCHVTLETVVIDKLGHDLAHHDAKAPTCTEIGWEAYDTCSRCDYTTYVEKPATGHNASEWIIDVNETCTTDGSKHKECTVCNVTLETVVIDKLGHDYDAVVTAPTCTDQGYTTHTCSRCDDSYVDSYVDATDHTYGEWTVDDVNGGHSRTCSDCLATQNQAHNWNGDVCSVCECAKYENSWKLVADASTLQAGDKIVIVCKTKNKIAGTGTSYLASIDVTLSSDQKTITSLPEGTLILTLGGSEGAWTLASPSGQLLGATAVKKLAWDNGKTTWSISIAGNDATIQNGTSTFGRFLYNVNSPRFTTYTSNATASMLLPQIYKHVEICRAHEAGETFGWDENNHWHICDNCGKPADSAVAHNPTEIPAVEATCTAGGFTAGTKCADCGVVITEPSATPALGHNWSYTAMPGTSTHTATCNRCAVAENQACVDEDSDNHCDLCGEQMEETYDITVQYTVDGVAAECPANLMLTWTDELGAEAQITNLFASTVRLLSVDVPSIYTVTVSGGVTTESGWKFTITDNITVTIELTKVELDEPTLTFDVDKSNRVSLTTEQQVWKQNGITFTNDKAGSSNDVADYSNPVRCYKSSTITVNYPRMVKVVFNCASGRAAGLNVSIDGATVTVDGAKVTVEFAQPVDTFTTANLSDQVRINSIDVYALPHDHIYGAQIPGTPATCTAIGTQAHYKCSVCEKLFLEEGGAAVTESDLVIPATGHTYTSIPEEPATCTATGKQAHYKCSVCKKLFLAEGGEEATAESLVLSMLSHNVESWTSNSDGTHSGTCTACGNIQKEMCDTEGNGGVCSKCGYGLSLINVTLINPNNATVTWYVQNDETYEYEGTSVTQLPQNRTYAISAVLEGYTIEVKIGETVATTVDDSTYGTLYVIPVDTNDITVNIIATEIVLKCYTKVTSEQADWAGTYLIVYEVSATEGIAFKGNLTTLDAASNGQTVTISDEKIASDPDTTDLWVFTIAKTDGGYSILSNSQYYIGHTGSKNALKSSTTTLYTNTITYSASEDCIIIKCSNYVLKYNNTSGQLRFRYYSSGQQPIQLYKLEG